MKFWIVSTIILTVVLRFAFLLGHSPTHWLNDADFAGIDRFYSLYLPANHSDPQYGGYNLPYGLLLLWMLRLVDMPHVLFSITRDWFFWIVTMLIDIPVIGFLYVKRPLFLFLYLPISSFQWVLEPVNMPVMWLCAVAAVYPVALPLAPIAKLPVGGPSSVLTFELWNFTPHPGGAWDILLRTNFLAVLDYGSLFLLWSGSATVGLLMFQRYFHTSQRKAKGLLREELMLSLYRFGLPWRLYRWWQRGGQARCLSVFLGSSIKRLREFC